MHASGKTPGAVPGESPNRSGETPDRPVETSYTSFFAGHIAIAYSNRVDGRIEQDQVQSEKKMRDKAGIGTEDEDLGQEEGEDTGAVDLPKDMVERLRVDLSVWKPPKLKEQSRESNDGKTETRKNFAK
jgi:hypothetical protein